MFGTHPRRLTISKSSKFFFIVFTVHFRSVFNINVLLLMVIFFSTDNDPWDWLAKLMNIFESIGDKSIKFESEMKEGEIKNLN